VRGVQGNVPNLIIKEVTVYLRHSPDPDLEGIRKIGLNGTEDIFSHTEVARLIRKGGKIIGVGGELYYNDRKYLFKVGYTEDVKDVNSGRVSVEKASIRELSKKELEDIYNRLLNIFEKYFILES